MKTEAQTTYPVAELRKKTGMTRQQFSQAVYNIPVRTIQDWELGQRTCADYIVKLIEHKLRSDNLI